MRTESFKYNFIFLTNKVSVLWRLKMKKMKVAKVVEPLWEYVCDECGADIDDCCVCGGVFMENDEIICDKEYSGHLHKRCLNRYKHGGNEVEK